MPKPLTSIVGEVAPTGVVLAKPARTNVRVEQLNRFQSSGQLFSIRLRTPEEMRSASRHVRKLTASIFAQAEETEEVKVVVSRAYDPASRRTKPQVVTVKASEVNRVPLPVALRLLDSDPYRYAFTEVPDPTAPTPTSVDLEGAPKPGQVTQFRQLEAELADERAARAELIEQLNEKDDEFAALRAQVAEMRQLVDDLTAPTEPNTNPAAAPKPGKVK